MKADNVYLASGLHMLRLSLLTLHLAWISLWRVKGQCERFRFAACLA